MIKNIRDCKLLNNGLKMPWLGFGVYGIADGGEVESAGEVTGGEKVTLQAPSISDDWLAVVLRETNAVRHTK